jgi:hypothetical protein
MEAESEETGIDAEARAGVGGKDCFTRLMNVATQLLRFDTVAGAGGSAEQEVEAEMEDKVDAETDGVEIYAEAEVEAGAGTSPPAVRNRSSTRAGWNTDGAEEEDHHADPITEADFAEYAKRVAKISPLDPSILAVLQVRPSTLGAAAGRGLFVDVDEFNKLKLPVYLPLSGVAREAGSITKTERKRNGCLFDTGLCVVNPPVRPYVI